VTHRFALAAALTCALARVAAADAGDTALTFAYVVPMGFGGVATAVSSTHLAYGEPAPRYWRWIGWISGGIDTAVGVTLFAVANDRTEGLVLGSLAVGVGAAALLTASFVEEDTAVGFVPVALPRGAGLGVFGHF
jgi:hypothetical protein